MYFRLLSSHVVKSRLLWSLVVYLPLMSSGLVYSRPLPFTLVSCFLPHQLLSHVFYPRQLSSFVVYSHLMSCTFVCSRLLSSYVVCSRWLSSTIPLVWSRNKTWTIIVFYPAQPISPSVSHRKPTSSFSQPAPRFRGTSLHTSHIFSLLLSRVSCHQTKLSQQTKKKKSHKAMITRTLEDFTFPWDTTNLGRIRNDVSF